MPVGLGTPLQGRLAPLGTTKRASSRTSPAAITKQQSCHPARQFYTQTTDSHPHTVPPNPSHPLTNPPECTPCNPLPETHSPHLAQLAVPARRPTRKARHMGHVHMGRASHVTEQTGRRLWIESRFTGRVGGLPRRSAGCSTRIVTPACAGSRVV